MADGPAQDRKKIMATKKSFPWGTLLLVLLLGGGGYGGWRWYSQRGKEEAVEYKTAAVAAGDIVQSVTANGALTPVRNVEVGSQISGTLLDVKVDFNAKVKTGDILAQIDPATYERALGQAEAELANSAAGLELAQLNYNRAKDLFAGKLISKSEFDEARINFSQSEATVKTRQANVDRAKVDLSRTTIYAPIDGMILTRKIEVGQTVAASLNSPTLFIIANDLAKMRIEAAVSEADVGGVTEGQTVNFTVDAFPARKFRGTIEQVRFAATTNQNVVTYTTVVEVNNGRSQAAPRHDGQRHHHHLGKERRPPHPERRAPLPASDGGNRAKRRHERACGGEAQHGTRHERAVRRASHSSVAGQGRTPPSVRRGTGKLRILAHAGTEREVSAGRRRDARPLPPRAAVAPAAVPEKEANGHDVLSRKARAARPSTC